MLNAAIWVSALVLATAKPSGSLRIDATVSGAKVFLDGDAVGATPLLIKSVAAGRHRIKVKKLGYLEATQEADVEAHQQVEIQLDLLPYAGVLRVVGAPKGASVFIDSKLLGQTPFEGEVPIGKRRLEVKKAGYTSYKEMLHVGAGNAYSVSIALQKTGDDLVLAPVVKSKKKTDEFDVPLASPPSLEARSTVALQPTSGLVAPIEKSQAWYQKWWVWTAAGAVIASAVVVPIVVTQLNEKAAARSFGAWTLDTGARAR